MKEEKNTVVSKFLSGKGFYAVLGGCLIAVGVAAWSAVAAIGDINSGESYDGSGTSYNNSTVISVPDEPVQQEVSDAPYEEPLSSEESGEDLPEIPVAEYFVMPISGEIIKDFDSEALQFSATYNDMRLHTGIDIKAVAESSVMACGDGTVTDIYTDALYGTVIVIDHGNEIVAKYCGMSENVLVETGVTVTAGQKIGTLGTIPSESADESHLHFELYKKDKAVSPMDTMDIQ